MPSAAQVRTRHTTELLSEILERLQSVERHVSDLYSSNETERRKQAANRRFFEIKKQVEGISQEIKDLSQAKRDTVHALNAIPDTDSTERSALLAHLAMIEGKAKQLWDLGDGLQAETVGIANALGLKVPGPSAPATPLTSSTT
jgi:predicted  nucleic acid-binding Zn-ribbon protein